MFPQEEGVWGKRLTRPPAPAIPLRRFGGSPIVRGWHGPAAGWVVGLFGNAAASVEWAESLQLPYSYACVAGLLGAGSAQDD